MNRSPSQKGEVRLILIGVGLVALVAGFLLFGKDKTRFSGGTIGPPPGEEAARKSWLAENIKGMGKEMIVLDEELPSWNELNTMKESFSDKKYPWFIKATQTYGTLPNLAEVLYFGDDLKDMGINTQFIHANYWYKDGEFYLAYNDLKTGMLLKEDGAKRALIYNILLAKKLGLSVILFPDYFDLENGGMNKLGITTDLEGRLEKIALELAKIAEEYNVEYLVPSNQIEMILVSNDYSPAESRERTNAYYKTVVPKIRDIYSGKIMYKMGGFDRWSNYEGISVEGADIIGVTACFNRNRDSLERVEQDIKEASEQASRLSKEYGVPWFNAEFVASDDEETSEVPVEEYYEVGLAAFNKYSYPKGARGFTVHSMLSSGQVYGTPAMQLLKTFFTSK